MKVERLSNADAARWHMATPENPMVIGALLEFEERMALGELQALVSEKLPPYRRFQQRVIESGHALASPCWVDHGRFDASAHVGMLAAPAPVTQSALADLVSRQISAALPPDLPPWRLDLIDSASGGSAVVVRIHHCIADGRALVAVLEDLGGRVSSIQGPRGAPSDARTCMHLRNALCWPLRGVQALSKLVMLADDPVTSLRGPLSGEKRLAWSNAIPISTIKTIARSHRRRFTEVVLGAVTGAIRHYLLEHGDSTARELRALLPMPWSPGPGPHGLGNRFASVFLSLPIGMEDPRRRRDVLALRLEALRRNGQGQLALGLAGAAGAVAARVEHFANDWFSRKASVVVSTLPGPRTRLDWAGKSLRSIVVWAPAPSRIAASLTLFGYAGELRLGVLTDATVIRRPQLIVDAFQRELESGR